MRKHIQTQSEWEQSMSNKIFEFVQNELFFDMPYMTLALHALEWKADDTIETIATDGIYLYYSSTKILDLFKTNARYINRAYLHSVLHCMFSHLWIRQDKDRNLWNLACDIAVEYTIDHLNKQSTQRILSLTRKKTYEVLENQNIGISAATIYYWLYSQTNLNELHYEFYTDDHRHWPNQENTNAPMPNSQSVQNSWQKISRQSMLDQKRKGKESDEGSHLLSHQVQAAKGKRNYKEFLKKFSITQEEIHSNPDEFDVTAYTYGLQMYKNMPLIEAVETKEVNKIQEFVIVIDTSYSTNGDLVKRFLKETYTILSDSDSFFKKTNIRILQCDDAVQKDDIVHNQQEMEQLLNQFTLVGGGNTDFRPAFIYVNELIQSKELKSLSGLLYFTDGKGVYPKRRPSYKTAFLFLDEYDQTQVPPWAISLQLDPHEWKGS